MKKKAKKLQLSRQVLRSLTKEDQIARVVGGGSGYGYDSCNCGGSGWGGTGTCQGCSNTCGYSCGGTCDTCYSCEETVCC